MQKTAIVTGITGQDGSIISRQLLDEGVKVYGLVRRRSDSPNLGCARELEGRLGFEVVEGDITDLSSLTRLCKLASADHFYHLASMSHVGTSFGQSILTAETTGVATLKCLEAIRGSGIHTRFYNAATSEQYGGISETPYTEESKFHPRSPYGCAKMFGYWITVNFRESYKMFASNGILFNHEAEGKRGPNFVTRKIAMAVAAIKAGKQEKLFLGNMDAKRDWGHADDFCVGIRMILNHNEPDDFVLATGETHTVREFCELAFEVGGLGDYRKYVEIDPMLCRPAEVHVLIGDYSKAKRVLGWEPTIRFRELVERMVQFELNALQPTG